MKPAIFEVSCETLQELFWNVYVAGFVPITKFRPGSGRRPISWTIISALVISVDFQINAHSFRVLFSNGRSPRPFQVVNILPYTTMTIAWSITEIIRYAFYFFALLGSTPQILIWMRYTFFYVLYPLGAGSEMVLLYKSLPWAKNFSTLLYVWDVLLLAIYPPGECWSGAATSTRFSGRFPILFRGPARYPLLTSPFFDLRLVSLLATIHLHDGPEEKGVEPEKVVCPSWITIV